MLWRGRVIVEPHIHHRQYHIKYRCELLLALFLYYVLVYMPTDTIHEYLGRENLSEIYILKGPCYYSSKITHLFNYSRSNNIFPSWPSDHICQHGGGFQTFSVGPSTYYNQW